ncbi:Ionotropic receptor 148, partial [Hyalella azteca]
APGTLLNKVYKKLAGSENRPDVIVSRVIAGDYAYLGPRIGLLGSMTSHFSKTGKCGLQLGTESAFSITMSFVFGKKFPLKTQIVRLRESGIAEKLLQDAMTRNVTVCEKPGARVMSETKLRALGVKDFFAVFAIFLGGIIASGLIFVMEVILHSTSRQTVNKTPDDSG